MPSVEIIPLPFRDRRRRRTPWRWLRDMALAFERRHAGRRHETSAPQSSGHEAGAGGMAVFRTDAAQHGSAVLPFPISGEAVLVRLAHVLRDRIGSAGSDGDRLLLTISRGPRCRLTIDDSAYVEFWHDKPSFHVAIEAAPDTTVSLTTDDFDIVVGCIAHYLVEKLAVQAILEVAS